MVVYVVLESAKDDEVTLSVCDSIESCHKFAKEYYGNYKTIVSSVNEDTYSHYMKISVNNEEYWVTFEPFTVYE